MRLWSGHYAHSPKWLRMRRKEPHFEHGRNLKGQFHEKIKWGHLPKA
jgi:hypothetical protein